MAKTVHCRDLGRECDFVARGLTDEELIEAMSRHLTRLHSAKALSPADREQIRSVIRDEGRPADE